MKKRALANGFSLPTIRFWLLASGFWLSGFGDAQGQSGPAPFVIPAPAAEEPARTAAEYRALLPGCDSILRGNPGHAPTLRRRALAYLRLHQYKEASADYGRLVSLRAATADDYLRRADARTHLADYVGTINDLTCVLRFHPGDIPTLMARGMARMHNNEFAKAAADFTRIIATADPKAAASDTLLTESDDEGAPQPAPRPHPATRPGMRQPPSPRRASAPLAIPDTTRRPPLPNATGSSLPVATPAQVVQAYRYRGIAYVALTEYKQGCQYLHKALALAPGDPDIQKDLERYCP